MYNLSTKLISNADYRDYRQAFIRALHSPNTDGFEREIFVHAGFSGAKSYISNAVIEKLFKKFYGGVDKFDRCTGRVTQDGAFKSTKLVSLFKKPEDKSPVKYNMEDYTESLIDVISKILKGELKPGDLLRSLK